MGSLKAFTKTLSEALELTPAALYERQRVLVSAKLLKPEKGRGPGSGVRATPRTVAMLLISVLAASALSDIEDAVASIARAKLSSKQRGPFDWETTFADALEWALSLPANASTFDSVTVEHERHVAQVVFMNRAKKEFISFGEREFGKWPNLESSTRLRGRAIKRIAHELHTAAWGEGDAG